MQTITNIDFLILNTIYEKFSCDFLDFLMPKITFLGNAGWIWILISVMMLIHPKYRKNGISLSISLICCVIMGNLVLKNLIARPRPCHINDTIHMLIAVPLDYSFPSGHAMSSFAAATVLMNTDKRYGIVAYTLASLIAFSRLYLYVHFPSDVLVGALLGTGFGILSYRMTCNYISPWLEKYKKGKKNEKKSENER